MRWLRVALNTTVVCLTLAAVHLVVKQRARRIPGVPGDRNICCSHNAI
jgi:hypothetical protein